MKARGQRWVYVEVAHTYSPGFRLFLEPANVLIFYFRKLDLKVLVAPYAVPLLPRPFIPHPVLGLLVLDIILSKAVLLAILPVPLVDPPIGPAVDPIAVLLVAIVLPLIELVLL